MTQETGHNFSRSWINCTLPTVIIALEFYLWWDSVGNKGDSNKYQGEMEGLEFLDNAKQISVWRFGLADDKHVCVSLGMLISQLDVIVVLTPASNAQLQSISEQKVCAVRAIIILAGASQAVIYC